MTKNTKTCDECGSPYFEGTSEMASLCAECSHLLFGYPNCDHGFSNGACLACGWDGSRSAFLAGLLKRDKLSDEDLKDELGLLDAKMKSIIRFNEVKALMAQIVRQPVAPVALYLEWRAIEYADTPEGLIDLTLLLNKKVVVKLVIPNASEEPVVHFSPRKISEYKDTCSSSDFRQVEIALKNK